MILTNKTILENTWYNKCTIKLLPRELSNDEINKVIKYFFSETCKTGLRFEKQYKVNTRYKSQQICLYINTLDIANKTFYIQVRIDRYQLPPSTKSLISYDLLRNGNRCTRYWKKDEIETKKYRTEQTYYVRVWSGDLFPLPPHSDRGG